MADKETGQGGGEERKDKGSVFDPHLAERTRAKNSAMYSKEESEWMAIDRVLHPQVN